MSIFGMFYNALAYVKPSCDIMYLAIVTHANTETGWCYISDQRLSKLLNVTPKTISRWRDLLAADGRISFVVGKGKGNATQYTVLQKWTENVIGDENWTDSDSKVDILAAKVDILPAKSRHEVSETLPPDNGLTAPLIQGENSEADVHPTFTTLNIQPESSNQLPAAGASADINLEGLQKESPQIPAMPPTPPMPTTGHSTVQAKAFQSPPVPKPPQTGEWWAALYHDETPAGSIVANSGVWACVLGGFQMQIAPATFQTWLADVKFISFRDGVLRLAAKSDYVSGWVIEKMSKNICLNYGRTRLATVTRLEISHDGENWKVYEPVVKGVA